MSDFTLIPSALKYPSSPNTDQKIDITLISGEKPVIEYERNINVSLQDVYNDERQKCKNYRPTFKISFVYENAYSGLTQYVPLRDNLYYINPELSLDTNDWYGFPQFYEFDFYRPQTYETFPYTPKSAYTYNWKYYLTYPYSNILDKKMYYTDGYANFNWISSDGIAFKIKRDNQNGVNLYSFICVTPHNLSPGEFVQFPFYYQSGNTFQVYSLGNNVFGSEGYIFNIVDIGYTGDTFYDGKVSTFKRKVRSNESNSVSKYYVRQHKVLRTFNDMSVIKTAFENTSFSDEKKLEYPILTPNNISRVSQKNSSNTYVFTLNDKLDISGLLDNQKRVLSELCLTIVHCGYHGLFNKPFTDVGLKQGWEFNIMQSNNLWWASNNEDSDSNILALSREQSGEVFYYNDSLNVDDLIDGDFCEWNDYEQREIVLSKYSHKIKYNPDIFNIGSENGFYYFPHISMPIRVFSDYIETGEANGTGNIPNWAFYSGTEFVWRDLYDIGFIDNTGNGVDYPFLNNSHYPFNYSVFRLLSEGYDVNNNVANNFSGNSLNQNITIDGCE